ncbi:ParB/RepB/Spo0J family partition protein [Aerococcus urinaeequi]|uniref:ParB/RepB/Spo0J family partition protein n=1 Tax=Aerococcus sp. HMSC10H05 TaxID=1581084 RepID=UPI0008A18E7E|nr:ParB/RepB/Spo0J family partition protein [Aerococcus sp. HMSC10H05]OFU52014.1 chromosome partitioning protein ParB [Aerococcus sp. HMSC10H05]
MGKQTNKHNRGLGRGIDAFFGNDALFTQDETDQQQVKDSQEATKEEMSEAAVETTATDRMVQEINVDDIRPNPYQPRHQFDEEALNDLAKSIQEQGIFQPITLRQSAVKGYEIIAGERRFRASKIAGLTKIPAIVRAFSDEQMIEASIIENLQREDLTALEEAMAYQQLIDVLAITQDEAAKRLGKSRTYITNHLRLLGLSDDIKALVQSGALSAGQARTILGLKSKKDQSSLAKKVVAEGITVRQLEKMVQALNEPADKDIKKDHTKKEVVPPYIRESEDRLMDKFGTNVQINSRGKRGKIEIEYLSEDDLTRILDILDIKFED